MSHTSPQAPFHNTSSTWTPFCFCSHHYLLFLGWKHPLWCSGDCWCEASAQPSQQQAAWLHLHWQVAQGGLNRPEERSIGAEDLASRLRALLGSGTWTASHELPTRSHLGFRATWKESGSCTLEQEVSKWEDQDTQTKQFWSDLERKHGCWIRVQKTFIGSSAEKPEAHKRPVEGFIDLHLNPRISGYD